MMKEVLVYIVFLENLVFLVLLDLLENLDIGSKLLIIGQADKQKWIFNGFLSPRDATNGGRGARRGLIYSYYSLDFIFLSYICPYKLCK